MAERMLAHADDLGGQKPIPARPLYQMAPTATALPENLSMLMTDAMHVNPEEITWPHPL